jgi:tetratricopeptide (TPR) repeat protein
MSWRSTAVAALAGLGLAACGSAASLSPTRIACEGAAATRPALHDKAQACSMLINAGATGDDLAAALRSRGEANRLLGDDADALADFNRAIGLDPANAAGFNGRGATLIAMGDPTKGLADFDTALRLAPGDATAYENRGRVELASGRPDLAMRDVDRAIELAPERPDAWALRGFAFLAKHELDLALADFADALRVNPRLGYALDGAGDAERAKGDPAGAVSAYSSAQSAYFDAGGYAQAAREADKLVALRPDDPELLNARCWERAIIGKNLGGALADCQRSLAIRPGKAEVLDSLAFVKFQMGRYGEAVRAYDAALAQDPKLSQSLYMRGVAKLRAGDQIDGMADMAAAKEINPTVQDEFNRYGVMP